MQFPDKNIRLHTSGLMLKVDLEFKQFKIGEETKVLGSGIVRMGPKKSDVTIESLYGSRGDLISHGISTPGFSIDEKYEATDNDGFKYLKKGNEQPGILTALNTIEPVALCSLLFENRLKELESIESVLVGGKNRELKIKLNESRIELLIGQKTKIEYHSIASKPYFYVPQFKTKIFLSAQD